MQIDVTLKNYRCFQDSHPASIRLQPGFVAFVGTNNSGKSTLLKFFYELRKLFEIAQDGQTFARALGSQPQVFSFQSGLTDSAELFCNANERNMQIVVQVSHYDQQANEYDRPDQLAFTIPRGTNTWRAELLKGGRTLPLSGPCQVTEQNGRRFLQYENPAKLDLTSFFQALPQLAGALYIGPFRNAINVGAKQDYFDIHVGQAFITRWRNLKTGGAKKHNEATYQLTDDIRRIFGFGALEINPTEDDQNIQLFIDSKSYRLTEQGAGLAQFILVLANAATQRPSFILIDEPELNLHPSLQLDFLTTLGSYTSQGGVLFATHSYGLARAAGDLVYAVHRDKDGARRVVPIEAATPLPQFLGELGYSGYTALGFSKVLLVEGPSEVKALQQFLRKRNKDHEVVILPLGGGSLIKQDCGIELQEVRRICDNVYALIDSEREEEGAPLDPARAAFKHACEELGIHCCVLERRATENYLTDAAVKKIRGEKYRALGPYELLKNVPFAWNKMENWRFARAMSFDDIAETDLGKFLAEL